MGVVLRFKFFIYKQNKIVENNKKIIILYSNKSFLKQKKIRKEFVVLRKRDRVFEIVIFFGIIIFVRVSASRSNLFTF